MVLRIKKKITLFYENKDEMNEVVAYLIDLKIQNKISLFDVVMKDATRIANKWNKLLK